MSDRRVEGKMRRIEWGLICVVFVSTLGYSQKYPVFDAATAGASSGASGYGRYWGNPAVWVSQHSLSAGQYLHDPFLMKELAVKGLGFTIPLGKGDAGVTAITEGFSLFRKQMLSGGYSRYFGKKVAIGLAFDYLNLNLAENYGGISGAGTHFGALIQLSPKLKTGTYLFFPIGNDMSLKECFQAYSVWGLKWEASDKLDVVAEIAKEAQTPAVIRAGMYYNDKKHLLLQGGINFFPASYFAGAGIIAGHFTFIMNSVYSSPLGFSPSVTLIYEKR